MYQYDVFISYRRSSLIEPWVREHFMQVFEEWLHEKLIVLGYVANPKIFFDQSSVQPGKDWLNMLQTALKHSKILVAICSPSYFTSDYCQVEWETFREREKMLSTDRLKIPVRHNDCENYLHGIQYSDFYGFTFPVKEFYQSAKATAFYDKVEKLAETVAKAIMDAPDFDPNWPVSNIPPHTNPIIPIHRL